MVELIRREAQRYGVMVHHSELVGLIPQEALVDAAVWYMQLDQFSPDQVLETRLFSAGSADSGSAGFLDDLAAGTPAPGGGSAAAYAGAMGAALTAMNARLTLGKKKYAEVELQMQAVLAETETLRAELTHAVDEDSAAFEAVMAAFKLPKDTPEQQAARAAAVEAATLQAAQVPLANARRAVRVIELAERAAALGNQNAITDAASGAAMGRAALAAAGYNVRINLASLADKTAAALLLEELRTLDLRAAEAETRLRAALEARAGI